MNMDGPSSGWRCQQCGLPGVRVSTRLDNSNDAPRHAYYNCVPCNRSLGNCPCTTPGAWTTSTCPCSERRGSDSSDLQVPAGVSMLRRPSNPHNPDNGFDEDWEANCTPGFMVKRFKAKAMEMLPH